MKSFADLKANARAALLGRYSTLIGAGLISWLISALLETPFSRMLQEGVYYTRFIRIIWGYTGMVFVSLVGALFTIGTMYMHVKQQKITDLCLQIFCFHLKTVRTNSLAVSFADSDFLCMHPSGHNCIHHCSSLHNK